MARRAKLPIAPRHAELAQQVLVQVALYILVLLRNLHLVNQIADFNQRPRFVQLKFGPLHVLPKGAFSIPHLAQPREHLFFNMLQCRRRWLVHPRRPPQLRRNLRRKLLLPSNRLLLSPCLGVIQPLQKQQVRKLLNRIHWVRQSRRPQAIPNSVNF